jgi:uncharacterized protein with PQ loop repeat
MISKTLRILDSQEKSLFKTIINYGMDILMVIAPLLTYCFQIFKFANTKSSKGFSKFICFLLFMGNILRVFFWFGIHFKKTLLYQSIGIVIFQVILIHLCIKYQEIPSQKQILPSNENNNQIEFDSLSKRKFIKDLLNWKNTLKIKNIWRWTIEVEYYKFMFLVIFLLSMSYLVLGKFKIFYHLIGIMSAGFESMTCVPQVVENYKTKNVKNISFLMMFFWFCGDSFRLYYNIRYNAPIQMILAVAIQVTADLIVCIQLCFYKDRDLKSKKIKMEEINSVIKNVDELNIIKKSKIDADNNQIEMTKSSSDEELKSNSPKLKYKQSANDSADGIKIIQP